MWCARAGARGDISLYDISRAWAWRSARRAARRDDDDDISSYDNCYACARAPACRLEAGIKAQELAVLCQKGDSGVVIQTHSDADIT